MRETAVGTVKVVIATVDDEDLLRGQLATMADLAKDLAEFAIQILHELDDGEDNPE